MLASHRCLSASYDTMLDKHGPWPHKAHVLAPVISQYVIIYLFMAYCSGGNQWLDVMDIAKEDAI